MPGGAPPSIMKWKVVDISRVLNVGKLNGAQIYSTFDRSLTQDDSI